MNEPTRPPVTDEEQRQRELLQYLKVGRCVNGVTHDVNNCLGAILAYAELTAMDTALTPETRRMVARIIDSVDRASALVTELTNVARPLKSNISMIDLRGLVRGITLLRDYDFRVKQVELAEEWPEEVPSLSGDVPRIRLALLYLVMNAEEALENTAQKKLTIALQQLPGGLQLSVRIPEPIPAPVQKQMFEAGFTTKGEKHLGLGLTTAREIFEDHGGTLDYDPERGFVVFLPFQSGHE